MATSSQAPELGIYASQCDWKCCFLILPILHYRNSTTMSNPVGFSWITHLNMRLGEHAQFRKTVLHADVSAQGMLFIAYILPFPFQVDNVPSPLGDWLPGKVLFWWHAPSPSATHGFDGRLGSACSPLWSCRLSPLHGFPPSIIALALFHQLV